MQVTAGDCMILRPISFRRVHVVAALLTAFTPSVLPAQELVLADGAVSIENPTVIPDSVVPPNWINSVVAPDGSVYLADMYSSEIVKLSSEGETIWSAGGKGDGPGEFQMLYRMGVSPSGRLAVYDFGRNELSILDESGEFVRRAPAGVRLRQVDAVLWPSDSVFVLAGTADPRGYGAADIDHGIHILDQDFAYARSFGPLPIAEDREVLNYWGAGVLTNGLNGHMLFTVRNPYDVYRYTPDGVQTDSIRVPVPMTGQSDDRILITRNPALSVRDSDEIVTVPLGTFALGDGMFIGGRIEGSNRYWTVFDSTGKVLDDVGIPRWGGVIVGVDLSTSRVWMRSRNELGVSHLIAADLLLHR